MMLQKRVTLNKCLLKSGLNLQYLRQLDVCFCGWHLVFCIHKELWIWNSKPHISSLNIKQVQKCLLIQFLSIPIKVRCKCEIAANIANNMHLDQMESVITFPTIEVVLFSGNLVITSLLWKNCVCGWQSFLYHRTEFTL